MASAGRTDEGGHGAGSREDPGGWKVERAPAGGAGRVWRQAVAGALSAAGLAAAALSLALVLAAPAASTGATTTTGKTVKISTAKVSGVGTVLTTASGLTLYRFTKDSPGTSTCTGACASIWPPLLAPKGAHVSGPHGLKGLTLPKVGNGHLQVAFDKLPLYRYAGDKKKGQAHGQNVAGSWFAVLKSGIPASARGRRPRRPRRADDHGARLLDHEASDLDDTDLALEREHGSEPDHAGADTGDHTGTGDPADDAGHLGAGGTRATDHDADDLPAAAHDDPDDQCRWRRVWLLGLWRGLGVMLGAGGVQGFPSGPGPSSAPRRRSPRWGGVLSPALRAGRGMPW